MVLHVVHGERAREPQHAGLGGAVGDEVAVAVAGHGGGVHDGAPAGRDHLGDHCPGEHEHPLQVQGHRAVPGLFGDRQDGAARVDAGVVAERVDAPVLLQGEAHDALDVGVGGHVGLARVGLQAALAEQLLGALGLRGVVADGDHGVAPRGERRGDRAADAVGAAGDDGDARLGHLVPPARRAVARRRNIDIIVTSILTARRRRPSRAARAPAAHGSASGRRSRVGWPGSAPGRPNVSTRRSWRGSRTCPTPAPRPA